jgi:hypothetical protein
MPTGSRMPPNMTKRLRLLADTGHGYVELLVTVADRDADRMP